MKQHKFYVTQQSCHQPSERWRSLTDYGILTMVLNYVLGIICYLYEPEYLCITSWY